MQPFTARLAKRLERLQVAIDISDRDATLLRGVPVHADHFSKSRTNLLLKLVPQKEAVLVLVDADLAYTGGNPEIQRLFARGWDAGGWKALFFEPSGTRARDRAMERVLDLLGSQGREPVLHAPAPPALRDADGAGLLAGIADDLAARAREGTAWPCVARDEAVIEAASCVRRWGESRFALVTGESGAGKTNLLHGVARMLTERDPEFALLAVNLERLFSGVVLEGERENLLGALLQEMQGQPRRVLALEHAELAVCDMRHGPLILANALDRGIPILGTLLPRHLPLFLEAPLRRRVHVVTLEAPPRDATAAMVAAHVPAIAAHHAVTIDEHLAQGAAAAAETLPDTAGSPPGSAVTLLDAAAARAALQGVAVVGLEDLYFAA
ncbi:MAG TPA: hypothetical protein PKL84_08185, partial [Candidatus Hydrogenedentes bacterium]|nr:hypothetical protein [Candidatus Hydrogenedentota bacterium]